MPKIRVCRSCDSPDVTSKSGPPVCEACKAPNYRAVGRRPCRHCGTFDDVPPKGIASCIRCSTERYERANRDAESRRQSQQVNCKMCGREYYTRTKNYECATCMQAKRRHPCADCGTPVDFRAECCMPCRGKRQRGEGSPHFKGGRTLQRHTGYILVRAPEGHPKRHQHSSGYVREHILVMEQALGRYLLPGENVHHRNGVKADNRLENLELWVKSQPAGQRVEDIADWAEELLRRYRPHLLRSPLTSPSHVSGDMSKTRGS